MDVLNTYGGGVDGWAVVATVWFAILTLASAGMALWCVSNNEGGTALFCVVWTVVCAAISVMAANDVSEPVRHEVVLRDGYVIDATKYEIIEQRGEIYVIEEREGAEAAE